MVGLFLRGFEQVLARGLVARDRGLAAIQRLRADLADMVDPHQSGRVLALAVVQFDLCHLGGRIGTDRGRCAEYRVERALAVGEEAIE